MVPPVAGERIVVIEDESLIASSIAARLRAEGFDVHLAGTGPEGVQLCRRVRPDLVPRRDAASLSESRAVSMTTGTRRSSWI